MVEYGGWVGHRVHGGIIEDRNCPQNVWRVPAWYSSYFFECVWCFSFHRVHPVIEVLSIHLSASRKVNAAINMLL